MSSDAGPLCADARAREDALDVSRSCIVQAPAGSGKTELLIQRYLRLLATVDNPEEVLAITFTKKAAAEMQLRVLQALRNAERGVTADEPHERITAAAAAAVLDRDARLQWQLVVNPRRLRIQTLDSLNASIARMQPMTAWSAAAGNAVVADGELKALCREAAAATLDWLDDRGPMRDATETVLLHVDNNAAIYIAYLAQMLETRDQWLPFVSSGTLTEDESRRLRRQFERSLEAIVDDHLQRTRDAFPLELLLGLCELGGYAAANLDAAGQGDSPITALTDSRSLPAPSSDELAAWRGIAELLLTRQGGWRRRLDKNQGFPPKDAGQKRAMLDALESLRENTALCALLHGVRTLPPGRYSDAQWRVLLALFRLLPIAVAEPARWDASPIV